MLYILSARRFDRQVVCPSQACHSEPVRTSAWESVALFPKKGRGLPRPLRGLAMTYQGGFYGRMWAVGGMKKAAARGLAALRKYKKPA